MEGEDMVRPTVEVSWVEVHERPVGPAVTSPIMGQAEVKALEPRHETWQMKIAEWQNFCFL